MNDIKTIKNFILKKQEYNKLCYLKHIANKESILMAELFATRNIEVKDIDNFLNPKLRNLLPRVNCLKDTEKASRRIVQAIENNEKICIYGDYDVDGIASTTLMLLYLRELNINAEYYIPDRLKEGYGANNEAIKKLYEKGVKLIIFVDCGATAFEPLDKAKQLGIDVVVLDHHKTDEQLPDCLAQVNPNRFDETNIDDQLHHLCACGVVFLTLLSCNKIFKEEKNKSFSNIPDLLQFAPLVAFATTCDVMLLTMLNRAFIQTGLSVLEKNKHNHIKTFNLYLLLESKNDEIQLNISNNKRTNMNITSYTFGFTLGPMINAGGRIGKSDLGVLLMTEKDINKAKIIANELLLLNNERKEIENNALREIAKCKQEIEVKIKKNGFILMYNSDWHEGVIGLIASRIKDKYYCPTMIGSEINNDMIRFSARSIKGVDIGKLILFAKELNLIENGGGHELAGGFTLKKDKIDKFLSFMTKNFNKNTDNYFSERTIEYTTHISLSGLTFDLLETIEKFGPFGNGNTKPIFLVQGVKVLDIKTIKDKHVFLIITDGEKTSQAFAFNVIGTDFGMFLLSSKYKVIDLLITAAIDNWNDNKKINIFIEDALG